MVNNNLLLDEYPLMVLPQLAKTVGLNEAIVLQQVHYWLLNNKRNNKQDYCIDGKWWVKASYPKWQKDNFPFWSVKTIQRTVTSLTTLTLLESAQHNKGTGDQSKFYTVNYEALDKLTIPSGQNDLMHQDKESISIGSKSPDLLEETIEETTTETKEKNNASGDAARSKPQDVMYNAIRDVFSLHGSLNGDYRKMLAGTATKKAYVEYNCNPPVTAEELLNWYDWYTVEKPELDVVKSPAKLQSSIYEYRETKQPQFQLPAQPRNNANTQDRTEDLKALFADARLKFGMKK